MSWSWNSNVCRWHGYPGTWKRQMWSSSQINSSNGQNCTWLSESCLSLNVSKTACMYFYIRKNGNQPDIFVNGEKIHKYLVVTVDSQLSFKKHIKQVCNTVKFNLRNFRYIWNQLPLDAAKLYMHSMIFSHIAYYVTSWSQTGKTTLAPLQTLYKQTLKVLDKRPSSHHHCNIIQKHKLLTFENLVCLADVSLLYKVIQNLAAPPLKEFISLRPDNKRTTRTTSGGAAQMNWVWQISLFCQSH